MVFLLNELDTRKNPKSRGADFGYMPFAYFWTKKSPISRACLLLAGDQLALGSSLAWNFWNSASLTALPFTKAPHEGCAEPPQYPLIPAHTGHGSLIRSSIFFLSEKVKPDALGRVGGHRLGVASRVRHNLRLIKNPCWKVLYEASLLAFHCSVGDVHEIPTDCCSLWELGAAFGQPRAAILAQDGDILLRENNGKPCGLNFQAEHAAEQRGRVGVADC